MNNISDRVDDSVREFLKKLGIALCKDGKEFLKIEDKNWETLLLYYVKDFQFNCRYPIINAEFVSQCKDKELLHRYGFYVNENIDEIKSNELTLLGNSKIELTLEQQTRIAIKDSVELVLYPESHVTIFLFDNAKVTIPDGSGEVVVRRYSDTATITSNINYKEYNYAKRNN